ncbi:MAG: hypothetical protein QOI80_1227 [Solirubrobacteraceae bacterium]|nr:hypothetical protein [Solirubrobacteraceae bacterium]
MKRSPALTPLSHDHQHALEAALRLRRADAESAAAAVTRFLAFFEREGRGHFELEEEVLLPVLPADDAEWGPAVERVHADHAAIRREADALAVGGGPSLTAVRALGRRLHDHVRFEERQLFEVAERRLSAEELSRLGRALAH